MAHACAGRVILHSCYPYGLWSASTESTGEGGTPAFLLSLRVKFGGNMNKESSIGRVMRQTFAKTNSGAFVRLVFSLTLGVVFVVAAGCSRQNAVKTTINFFKKNPRAGKAVGVAAKSGAVWYQNRKCDACNGSGQYWNSWQGCYYRCNVCRGSGKK